MFARVLFACPLAPAGALLSERMLAMLGPFGPHIILFHAYPARDAADAAGAESLEARIRRRLAVHVPLFEAQGCSCELLVVPGHPGRSLVRCAGEQAADLIVTGSRGLDGYDAARLGSTSLYVLQHSACPVLILPPLDAYQAGA